jgi:hypothetical protein
VKALLAGPSPTSPMKAEITISPYFQQPRIARRAIQTKWTWYTSLTMLRPIAGPRILVGCTRTMLMISRRSAMSRRGQHELSMDLNRGRSCLRVVRGGGHA